MAAVGGHSESMSDRAMLEATGRHPEEWFAFLDAQGATAWTHTRIARWLFDEAPQIGGWWCQAVTVRYEQARGMRLPGQQADGTFSTSVTRSLAAEQPAALERTIAAVRAEYGEPKAVTEGGKYPSARWKLESGETLLARINPTKSGKSGASLTWSKIPDAAGLEPAKAVMSRLLDSIAE